MCFWHGFCNCSSVLWLVRKTMNDIWEGFGMQRRGNEIMNLFLSQVGDESKRNDLLRFYAM